MKTGLVLEGGGLRGIYTVGVLDVLMEEELFPDYAVGEYPPERRMLFPTYQARKGAAIV